MFYSDEVKEEAIGCARYLTGAMFHESKNQALRNEADSFGCDLFKDRCFLSKKQCLNIPGMHLL